MRVLARLRVVERATRPENLEFAAAADCRWREPPDHVKTPGQVLGRHGVGCEGTHGVFPKCNFACTPCYRSRDANRVRIDSSHTVLAVDAQMELLERLCGPVAHAQLIGSEVCLLPPDDHAAALRAMRSRGREPMSFTHGDFGYDYLERLALGSGGTPRFARLSFAAHFDRFMYGRKGISRPASERSLNPYRKQFADMFTRLREEHGVRSLLAQDMTVTLGNLAEVAEMIRDCHAMGYRMFSFQPAAMVGDNRRWKENYREVTSDTVWAEIERGEGTRLDYRVFEHGDVRCNRVAYGFYVGERWHPFLDGGDPRDLRTRDAFFRYLGRVSFTGAPTAVLAVRLGRVIARHPRVAVIAVGWAVRAVHRVGLFNLWQHRRRIRLCTFVMHHFMDAVDVTPA